MCNFGTVDERRVIRVGRRSEIRIVLPNPLIASFEDFENRECGWIKNSPRAVDLNRRVGKAFRNVWRSDSLRERHASAVAEGLSDKSRLVALPCKCCASDNRVQRVKGVG